MNFFEHPTGTLVVAFRHPSGVENLYVQLEYLPQTICSHTQGQVLGSKNSDLICSKKTGQQSPML